MYLWPQGLEQLGAYLQKRQVDIYAFKTARQAAWTAQKLLKTRIKFNEDLYVTLREIQKAVPQKERALTGAPQKCSKPAGRKESAAAPARSTATRSTQAVHSQRSPKVNDIPDISVGLHVFCDGGCEPNPGAGGWGVVVYSDGVEVDHAFGGGLQETNNTMELSALINAISVAKTLDGSVTIWSDSQYAVKGTNEWMAGWKRNGWSRKGPNATRPETGAVKNLDLWKLIDEAMTVGAAHISIKWVKGHVGVVGNERADELSLMGRREVKAILEATID